MTDIQMTGEQTTITYDQAAMVIELVEKAVFQVLHRAEDIGVESPPVIAHFQGFIDAFAKGIQSLQNDEEKAAFQMLRAVATKDYEVKEVSEGQFEIPTFGEVLK